MHAMHRRTEAWVLVVALAACFQATAVAGVLPVYDIPRIDNVVIDGNDADWGSRGGLRVDLLAAMDGDFKALDDHATRLRVAWDMNGLLLLVYVWDDVWVEHPEDRGIWIGDGVEVFLAPHRGARDRCQWLIAPGMTKLQPEPRWYHFERRQAAAVKNLPAELEVARTKTENGHVLETRLPWSALAIRPASGRRDRRPPRPVQDLAGRRAVRQ